MSVVVLLSAAFIIAEDQIGRDVATSDNELRTIHSLLTETLRNMGEHKSFEGTQELFEGTLVVFTKIMPKLAIFELEFGVQPKDINGWEEIENTAKDLLSEFRQFDGKKIHIYGDSLTAYCTLLELAGKQKKALQVLNSVNPDTPCGTWYATVLMPLELLKSAIYQRIGNYAESLKEQETAIVHSHVSFSFPDEDILYVRYAFLLSKNNRETEAILNYQRTVDLYPGTAGSRIARKALIERNALLEPAADRIDERYLKPDGDDKYAAILALAKHKFPTSAEIISARLNKAGFWERGRLIHALGILGDKAAISSLNTIVTTSDYHDDRINALKALHKLGDDSQVAAYLMRFESDKDHISLDWVDSELRKIMNGGPVVPDMKENDNAILAQTWLDWINKKKKTK